MSDETKETPKYHEYDGIIEHDNPLPTWWLWTFFLTIIFSFLYFIHYQLGGPGMTLADELKTAMKEIERLQSSASMAAPLETEESLAAAFARDGVLVAGASQYASKCASCHGAELQGVIGPNLTDPYWIHGKGTRLDLLKVLREGVAEKGMPPWAAVMKREEIYSVAAFILAKQGSNPAGAKAAEGELASTPAK